MKIKSNEVRKCPFCNSKGTLSYGAIQLEIGMCYFSWQCKKCKHEGEEWYYMNFAGHNVIDEDGDNIEIEDMTKIDF